VEGKVVLREFRDFVMRGNVVELAVAVIVGAAFGAVITAFTAAFITPLIALIGGKSDFGALRFTISGTVFPYGQFLNALISFLIIAAVVFFFVVRPMNALMTRFKRPDEEPDAPSAEVATLLEIRDLLAGQPGGGDLRGSPY
jgi:large conductance mechanosensitive channel